MNNEETFILTEIDEDIVFKILDGYKINNDQRKFKDNIAISDIITDNNVVYINIFLLIKSSIKCVVCSKANNEYSITKPKTFIANKVIEDFLKQSLLLSIKYVKINYNKKMNYYLLISSDKEVYLQSIDNINEYYLIFKIEDFGVISNIFLNPENSYVIIVIDENILIEVRLFEKVISFLGLSSKNQVENMERNESKNSKDYQTLLSSLYEYILNNSIDKLVFSCIIKYTSSLLKTICPYHYISPINKALFEYMIYFENEVKPIDLQFKPSSNEYVVSFKNGFVCILNSLKQMSCVFKTTYGNIISMSFSSDGRLLGLGCEDDNIYIIDTNKNLLLYTLIGHDNYISSILFREDFEEEADFSIKNMKKELKPSKNMKIYTEEVDLNEMISNIYEDLINKQIVINNKNSNEQLTADMISVPVKSKILSNKNLNYIVDANPKKKRFLLSYILYSSSFDGTVSTWQIDNIIEKDEKETSLQCEEVTKKVLQNEEVKLDRTLKIVCLDSNEDNSIKWLSNSRLSSTQVFKIIMLGDFFIYLSKMSSSLSDVYLRIYTKNKKEYEDLSKRIYKKCSFNANKAVELGGKYKNDDSEGSVSTNKFDNIKRKEN